MDFDLIIKLLDILVWPLTIVLLIYFLRHAIAEVIKRIKGLEGPSGWKLLFEVRKVGTRLEKLEDLATDIYHLSGKNAIVRDEIFAYVAKIINNASDSTALEMRTELNKYHFSKMNISVVEIKIKLESMGLYERFESESKEFDEIINSNLIKAIYSFQKSKNMEDADGIIGPSTLRLIESLSN